MRPPSPQGLTPSLPFDPARPNAAGQTPRFELRLVYKPTGEVLVRHQASLAPQSYAVTPTTRELIRPTLLGYHVDRPSHALGLVRFEFSGQTGRRPRGKYPGAPDGFSEIYDLVRIVELYLSGEFQGVPASDLELELYDPFGPVTADDPAGDSLYVVQPEGVSVPRTRSAARALATNYRLTLVATKRIGGEPLEPLDEPERSLLDLVRGALRTVNQFNFDTLFSQYLLLTGPIRNIAARVGDVRSFLDGWARGFQTFINFHRGEWDSLVADLAAIRATIRGDELVFGASAPATEQRGQPASVADRQLEALELSLRRVAYASQRYAPSRGSSAATGRQMVAGASEERPGPMAEGSATAADQLGLGRRTMRGYRKVVVQSGDSLTTVTPPGFNTLDVLRLNPDLEYPFVDGSQVRGGAPPATGVPRIAMLGEVVLVPSTEGRTGRNTPTEAGRPSDAPGDLFGVDWAVVDGDFVFDAARGDLAVVRGDDALRQRLRHLLLLRPRDLHYAPAAGLRSDPRWNGAGAERALATEVRRTLLSDPDVDRLSRLAVTIKDGVAAVQAAVQTEVGIVGNITLEARQ